MRCLVSDNHEQILSNMGSLQDYLAGKTEDGELVELRGMIRPMEDVALYRAEMAAWPTREGLSDWEERQPGDVDARDHRQPTLRQKGAG